MKSIQAAMASVIGTLALTAQLPIIANSERGERNCCAFCQRLKDIKYNVIYSLCSAFTCHEYSESNLTTCANYNNSWFLLFTFFVNLILLLLWYKYFYHIFIWKYIVKVSEYIFINFFWFMNLANDFKQKMIGVKNDSILVLHVLWEISGRGRLKEIVVLMNTQKCIEAFRGHERRVHCTEWKTSYFI